MNDDLWIVVPNWDKFQHYSDREPVWIKVYTELNSSPDWLDLSVSERGVLVSIWLEYARSRGVLRVLDAGKRLGLPSHYAHFSRHLEALNHAGFIRFAASKPLALARSREEEVREEKNAGARTRKKPVDNSPQPQRANMLPKDPAQAIRAMIANGVITDFVDLEAEIAGARLNSDIADKLRGLIQ